jgi:hypothetical protein
MKRPPRPTVDAIAAQAQAQREAADRALHDLLHAPIRVGWMPQDAAPRECALMDRAAIAEHRVGRLVAYISAREAGLAIEQALAQAMAMQQHTKAASAGRSADAAAARDRAQRVANAVLSVVQALLGDVPTRGYHKLLENLWPAKEGGAPSRSTRGRLREGFQMLPLDDAMRARLRSLVGEAPSPAALVAPRARRAIAAVVAELLAD